MVSKNHDSPPRKGPKVEAELRQLYQRRLLLTNLIRTLEAYARAGPPPATGSTRKAA
jgi:hypothetical protein